MAAKKGVRNYNAFVKEARAKHGLSLREAQKAYRAVTERLGRPARGVDVKNHPRITKQEAQSAIKAQAKEDRARKRAERETSRERPEKREKKTAATEAPPAPKAPKTFKSLQQYMDWFDAAEDYDYEEADGTVDYTEGRHR